MKPDPITRYIKVKDLVMHFKVSTLALAEADEYGWMRAGEGALICEHGEQIYPVLLKNENGATEIACGCPAWQFAKGNDGCKHVSAFLKRKEPVQKPISDEVARDLMKAGWTGGKGNLQPPAAEIETTSEPELGEKIYTRSCPHCDEKIGGTDLDAVKRMHSAHIAECEQNPANKKASPATGNKTKPVATAKADSSKPERTGAKSATVEIAQEERTMTTEPEQKKTYTHPDGTEFETAEAFMSYADDQKAAERTAETKALITPTQPDRATQVVPAWSDEQIDVMRKTVAERATPAEFAYFLNVAAATGLNPFLKEIYFMKTDKGQTSIITGRDGYLTIAKRDPRFRGIQSMEVCKSDEFEMGFADGRMDVTKHQITDFKDRGEIIGAWCRGQMEGQDPVTIFVSWAEYNKGGNIWKMYGSAMIRKVAEAMVLKRIAGISGLVTEAEISGSRTLVLDAEMV